VSSISDIPPPLGVPRNERATAAKSANRQDRVFIWFVQGVAAFTLIVIAGVAIFVFKEGWPSFQANGLSWFTAGDIPLDRQLGYSFTGGPDGEDYTALNAWPAIAGTILSTGGALLIAFPLSLLTAIFLAELAPKRVADFLSPVVTMLAATPSVVFGLFAILVLGPWMTEHLISESVASQLAIVVPIGGASVLLATIVFQAVVGVIQSRLGVPPLLVGLHMLGASVAIAQSLAISSRLRSLRRRS